jgi:hypothetical protein
MGRMKRLKKRSQIFQMIQIMNLGIYEMKIVILVLVNM